MVLFLAGKYSQKFGPNGLTKIWPKTLGQEYVPNFICKIWTKFGPKFLTTGSLMSKKLSQIRDKLIWFDCCLQRKCTKAYDIISGFCWYIEFPNLTKFNKVIRYFALFETIHIWIITREIFAGRRIAIWGLRSARIKKLKKTDPHFFWKKWGLFSSTFWSEHF